MADLRYGTSKRRQTDVSRDSYQRRLAIDDPKMRLLYIKKQSVSYIEFINDDDDNGRMLKRMYVNGNDGFFYCYSQLTGIKKLNLPTTGMNVILYKLEDAIIDDKGAIQLLRGKVFRVVGYSPNKSYTIHRLELVFVEDVV